MGKKQGGKFLVAVLITCLVFMVLIKPELVFADLDHSTLFQEEEPPFITVYISLTHHYYEISVEFWTPGEDLTLSILDPAENPIIDPITRSTDDGGWVGFYEGDFDPEDLSVGNTVIVSGVSGERTFTIPHYDVEVVDVENDIVRGTTDPGRLVVLQIQEYVDRGDWTGYEMFVGPTGEWEFYTAPEFPDLTHFNTMELFIFDDDGDRLSLLNVQMTPHMIVAASRANYINLRDWEIGSLVTIINDDNDDLTDGVLWMVEILIEESDEHPGMGEYHSWRYDHVPPFEVGDYVTATDGDVTVSETGVTISEGARTKFLFIEELYCDWFDTEAKIAKGRVPDGLEVSGIIQSDAGVLFTDPFYGSNGLWTYDLSLFGEELGGAYYAHFQVFDADSDNTNAHCYFPSLNTPPEVGGINAPLDPVPVGTVVEVSAPFTDPDNEDWMITWDWGDGSSSEGTYLDFVAYGSHIYQDTGVYTVELSVFDGVDTGTATYQYIVVYDPEGGFVTGGGWINSPEGAYALDPSLSGKASFGFVSKYKKGADLPTGNTEFHFQTADFHFRSAAYTWLVIAGEKAIFKGEGELNGQAGYGFMISAIDGSLLGADAGDRFRIMIWDSSTENLIYDNQLDAPVDADPLTLLEGGSVVIHKK